MTQRSDVTQSDACGVNPPQSAMTQLTTQRELSRDVPGVNQADNVGFCE